MPPPPGPPESFIFLAFSYSILRLNLSLKFASSRGASAPRTSEFFIFLAFFYSILRLSESARCVAPPDLQNPSFSYGIPCIFLLHTEAQFKLIFCGTALGPSPRSTRILHFPLEFLVFSFSILRLNLNSFSAKSRWVPRPGLPESFTSLWNSFYFPTPY